MCRYLIALIGSLVSISLLSHQQFKVQTPYSSPAPDTVKRDPTSIRTVSINDAPQCQRVVNGPSLVAYRVRQRIDVGCSVRRTMNDMHIRFLAGPRPV
jgi:hypothetical protein